MRKRVYLAGPISKGDLLHNVNQATRAFTVLAKSGCAPWCPAWSVYSKPAFRDCLPGGSGPAVLCEATAQGNSLMSHDDWLGVDLAWVAVADAVLRLPGESIGADREVAEARRLGIPVFDSVEAVVAWAAA